MTKTLFAIILFFACLAQSQSQFISSGGSTLLKGYVKEQKSGKPIGVQITFVDSEGKKIKTKSNELTGLYEQLLPSGKTFEVVFVHPQILRSSSSVSTNETTNYTEQNQDFTVERIHSGAVLDNMNLFAKNSSDLNPEALEALEELKAMMRINRSLFINIKVSAQDSFSGKKAAKDCAKLSDKRKEQLDKYLESWKTWKTRVNLSADHTPGEKIHLRLMQ